MSSKNHKSRVNTESAMIKEAVTFSASTYIFQFISVIRGLIIAHILSPSLYGIWNILKVFFQLGSYINLGSMHAMAREVPFYEGQGNSEKSRCIKQTTLTWCLLLSIFIGSSTCLLSFTPIIDQYQPEIRLASLVFIFNVIHLYIRSLLRSERKIYTLSRYNITYALLNTAFGLSLLLTNNVAGLLAGMFLAMFIHDIVLLQKKYIYFNLQLHKETLKKLFRVGFPIMLFTSTTQLISNIDKGIIFFMLGSIETGYFGLASFFSEIVHYLPYAITTVLLPRMVFKLGQKKTPKELEHFYIKPLYLLSGIIPIILGFIVINIDLLILYLIPKYTPSIEVLRILVVGVFFDIIWSMPKNILIALNKQKVLMLWVPAFLFLTATIDILAIYLGYGIMGIAIGSLLVLFMVSLLTNLFAIKELEKNTREKLIILCNIYGPCLYILSGLVPIFNLDLEHPLETDMLRSFAFFCYCLPLLLFVNKHSQIFQKVVFAFAKS